MSDANEAAAVELSISKPIRLDFPLDSKASKDELSALARLTERCCVVFHTLAGPASISGNRLAHR